MSSSAPAVLVSSTYYDLGQVRTDLIHFMQDELGYTPLAFEEDSFPVDPDLTTIENCQRRVEKEADCLVLIVGGRYGYVDTHSGRSVTNLEYLAARNKGIPVYVYLEKQTAYAFEMWKKKPDNDFSSVVDNPKLFEFISQFRDQHQVWTGTFERAQHIVASLRARLSHLTKTLLEERLKLKGHTVAKELAGLKGKAYQIALQRPKAWEYRLFSQMLTDRINDLSRLRRDYDRAFAIGVGERVGVSDQTWTSNRMDELQIAIELLSQIVNADYQQAVGPPGESGDTQLLCDTASRIAEVYKFAMEWTQLIRRTHFHEILKEVQLAMCEFSGSFVTEIERLEAAFREGLKDIDEKLARGDAVELEFTLKLELKGGERFSAALDKARVEIDRRRAMGLRVD